MQRVSQKIKTADVFQRSPPRLTTTKILLVQPVEHWKLPLEERNISVHETHSTHKSPLRNAFFFVSQP